MDIIVDIQKRIDNLPTPMYGIREPAAPFALREALEAIIELNDELKNLKARIHELEAGASIRLKL